MNARVLTYLVGGVWPSSPHIKQVTVGTGADLDVSGYGGILVCRRPAWSEITLLPSSMLQEQILHTSYCDTCEDRKQDRRGDTAIVFTLPLVRHCLCTTRVLFLQSSCLGLVLSVSHE